MWDSTHGEWIDEADVPAYLREEAAVAAAAAAAAAAAGGALTNGGSAPPPSAPGNGKPGGSTKNSSHSRGAEHQRKGHAGGGGGGGGTDPLAVRLFQEAGAPETATEPATPLADDEDEVDTMDTAAFALAPPGVLLKPADLPRLPENAKVAVYWELDTGRALHAQTRMHAHPCTTHACRPACAGARTHSWM